jgi:hypothetical protein
MKSLADASFVVPPLFDLNHRITNMKLHYTAAPGSLLSTFQTSDPPFGSSLTAKNCHNVYMSCARYSGRSFFYFHRQRQPTSRLHQRHHQHCQLPRQNFKHLPPQPPPRPSPSSMPSALPAQPIALCVLTTSAC